jgi:2-amino-4-hydroxy-6-hydroxymethyldihydropteridine diphosphokinase
MKTVYLGLGSNLGDRRHRLQQAIFALASPRLHIRRLSPVYETEPMDLPRQPWFLNLVAEAETELFPMQLLRWTRQVEHRLGRRRVTPKGPRTIDIDILLFSNAVVHRPSLQIPHPRLHQRRFVLAPLADLAPDLRAPLTGKNIRELLAELTGQSVHKIDFQPKLPEM